MLTISHRIKTLLTEISANTCADIGCDHGKLIVEALLRGKIQKGYAIDISPESLKKTKELSSRENVSSMLTILCGDGGTVLPEKVDIAVIAGMGANEIIHILSEKDFSEKYLLSPHQDAQILRRYLSTNGYHILKDYIIYDKKYYPIILTQRGPSNYLESEMYFGKNLPETEEYRQYIELRKSIIQKIIEKTDGHLNAETESEWREIQQCDIKK